MSLCQQAALASATVWSTPHTTRWAMAGKATCNYDNVKSVRELYKNSAKLDIALPLGKVILVSHNKVKATRS